MRDPACDEDASKLAAASDAAARKEARRRILGACREARTSSGRMLWPLAAIDALRDGDGDAAGLSAWIEAHAADLSPIERRATLLDVESLDAIEEPARRHIAEVLASPRSRRDDLARELGTPEARAALYLEDHTAARPPVAEGPAVRVEQAERALDMGRDAAGARATLEAIVADQAVPADVRERATFALSRAFEQLKDKESAIRTIEGMLAAHVDDRSWPAHEAAEKRLRVLLTGKEDGPPSPRRPEEKVAPIARVLAASFPVKKDQPTELSVLSFGSDGFQSEALGTFRIGDALREMADEACPLCDTKLDIRASFWRTGSWTSIPAARGRLATSLAVFYTHLGDPIPARYDDVLPLPMSEVIAHLQKGEGLVIAKERPNAPPAILLAAPREAQLGEVEEAFAQMKALPGSLTVVKVAPNLKPDEIRAVMRTKGMPAFKKCYEALLTRAPGATGKAETAFTIKADGTLDDVRVETTDGLKEGTFQRCMDAALSPLAFAATGQTTTVKYPFTFSP